jgi:hypothetical protein
MSSVIGPEIQCGVSSEKAKGIGRRRTPADPMAGPVGAMDRS